MATIRETRRKNLANLLTAETSQAGFARALEVEPAYVSQLVRGRRGIGDRTARKIERARGLPVGWMDQPHGEDRGAEPRVDGAHDIPELAAAWRRLTPSQRGYYRESIFRDAAINAVMPWFQTGKPASPTYDAFERGVERDFADQLRQMALFDTTG